MTYRGSGGAIRVVIAAAALVSASTVTAAPGDPDPRGSLGEWSPLQTWPVSATHSLLLPTGKVLVIGEFEEGHHQYLWDPGTAALTALPDAGYNIFCAGHSRLEDGRILFSGGHTDQHVGLREARLFDASASTWSALAPMRDARWYPTSTTLASGEVLVLSGEMNGAGDLSVVPEVFDPATHAFRALDAARRRIPYYPRCFVGPDARVFCAGPAKRSAWLDPAGAGKWTEGPLGLHGTGATTRDYGSAAMIGSKVYLFGGDNPPTATNEVIDLASPEPRFGYVAPMSVPRRQHNAVILPDGRVLVVGGSRGAGFDDRATSVLYPEVYDPDADAWTALAETPHRRGYHASALLLPDGRVLVGGGRFDHTAQVFSPPYLFRGPRPRVTSAPATLELGQRFRIETADAGALRSVVLVRLGSVTHAFDQDQRLVELSFEAGAGVAVATAPASNALAPPGDYLLFAVNADGVPSMGRFVRLGRSTWSPPPDEGGIVAAEPPPTGAGGGGGGCASGGGVAAGALAGIALAALRRRRPAPRARR